MYRKISLVDAEKAYIKTFGGFDLYYRGKEIDFSNAKAKELLAVLVDQGGREVSLHEMAQILSDGEDDETARQAVHVAWSRLKKTLVSYGLGEYMPEYSWAEVTLSYLLQKFEEIKTRKIREAQNE